MGISFIIPLYNEEENIRVTIETVVAAANELGLPHEVVVVDDASYDRSVQVVEALDIPGVRLVCNKFNQGFAKTYENGVRKASMEFVQYIPSDDVIGKTDLVAVLKHMEADTAVLQYCMNINERSGFRRWISQSFTRYMNSITGKDIKYYNGLNIYPRSFVLSFNLFDDGFAFQAELVLKALRELKIKQVGTTCCFRDETSSALKPGNVMRVLWFMAKKRLANQG